MNVKKSVMQKLAKASKQKQRRQNNQFMRSFENAVIKPSGNDLQVELSKKLNQANSNKLISWERLKSSLLASAHKVALYPTLLTMADTEVLADRENARLTLYKDGTAVKSYKLLVGDTFKLIG